MSLNTKDFNTVVSDQVTTIQSQVPQFSNFNSGTVLLAIVQAVASVVMYLQSLLTQMYAFARASTSAGSDLDSWMADFGLTRLPAVAASGQVTFARFTPTAAATIPVGTNVESGDGTQVFAVIADATNPNYVPSQSAYVCPANTSSIAVTVQDTVAGAAGNVIIGALNTLTSPIVGIDTVTNAAAYLNGANAETDAAFRIRFQNYLASLAESTPTAIGNAIASVQAGLTYTLTEDLDFNGATDNGYFYVVVDDGSGAPSGQLLANIAAAINLVRAAGVRFGVFGPTVLTANIAMTITTAPGYTHSVIVAAVTAAIEAYVNALAVGATLPYTILASIAYSYGGGGIVTNVTGVGLNSGTSDLVPTGKQVIKYGTVVVT
ncbi:MAG TPA: baseplate J/gp47 family protein [Gammaproteobacteria bacterium]|jgi:uncharacterized phage protein gp47/JayE